ncbi:MAG: hypothetical protein LBG10_06700 [Treponema sp.]|jgi:hypothetical protein|nr:hypothetical protein [Treponema sp.]
MKRKLFTMTVLPAAMLFAAAGSAFTQEALISEWGYGLETSFGVTPGSGLPDNYSLSFQGMHDAGLGLSLDWIKAADDKYRSGLMVNSGLLGSALVGIIRLGYDTAFIPYVGGGLGVKFNGDEDVSFAWKVDGGAAAWLFETVYVKTGVSYDNIRQGLSITAGVGVKLQKTVSAEYRRGDGSTFRHTFTKYLWQDNSSSNYVYEDKFVSSEVVKTYQTTTTTSQYIAPVYEWKTSGGETVTTTFKDQYGRTTGTATSKTEEKREYVETKASGYKTTYYVYNVTVTRNWYTRTYYYKDSDPTTQRIYQDTESAVLVNSFSETE